jgi:hypothetical protein
VRLAEQLAWARGGWGELVEVAGARAARQAVELSVHCQGSGDGARQVVRGWGRGVRGADGLYRRGRGEGARWTDRAQGERARVGQTPACRPGSNMCARCFCPSSGACSHLSRPALVLVSAQNLFPFPQAIDLVWWSKDLVD